MKTIRGLVSIPALSLLFCFLLASLQLNGQSSPLTVADFYTVDEGGTLSTPPPGVLLNDFNPDTDVLSAVIISDPVYSNTFSFNSDGSFQYTHDGSENSTDVFTYVADDGGLQSEVTPVTITVNPVNDLPVITAIGDQGIQEGESFISFTLDDKVSDAENTPAQLAWEASGNEDLEVDIDDVTHVASIIIPDANWNGSKTITFTVTDLENGSDSDDAVFTVSALADAPVALDEGYTVNEGSTLNVPAPGVLGNDTDGDGDLLFAELVTAPNNNSAFALNSNGSFQYEHDGSETGSDVFTYVANDGELQSEVATVSITVTPVNDLPVITAIGDQGIQEGGTFATIALNDKVSDEEDSPEQLSWETSGNKKLTVEINDVSHIARIIVPNAHWSGSETITFTVTDLEDGSDSDDAVFTVSALAEAPFAQNDEFYVNEGATLNVPAPGVLGNDSDGDLDPITAEIVDGPVNSSSFTLNANGSFTYVHNGSETSEDSFTYQASDGGLLSNIATVIIHINTMNDPPVLANIPGETILEDMMFATINLDDQVADPDHADNLINWTYFGNSQLNVSIVNRVATITAPPDWNGFEIITFAATDPLGGYDSDPATFTVTAINDAPELANIEGAQLAYTEGSGAVQITNTIAVDDPDHVNLAFATIQVSANYQPDQDVLSFVNGFGLTGSWNSGSGTLTLNGITTLSNFQAALRTVRYANTSLNPLTSARTITFRVNDGITNSNAQQRTISINETNNAPVLADPSSANIAFTENGGSVQLTNTITVADDDDLQLSSALISITSGWQLAEDVLSFIPVGGITGSYNPSTGILTLGGVTTLANYQTALRSVRYNNSSENPAATNRTITFTVNDGTANSNGINKTATITAVNDAPVLAGIEPATLAYAEGSGAVQITNTITVADPDDTNLASATISVSANYQPDQDILSFVNGFGLTGSWNSGSGTLTLNGNTTLANYQNALRTITYTNTSLNPNVTTRAISFTVFDGAAVSTAQIRNISINTSNNAPVLTDPSVATVAYTENGTPVLLTSTIAIADADHLQLTSASIAITSGFRMAEDSLSFTPSGGIAGAYSSASGILALSGTATLANYQTALRSVRYKNRSEDPNITNRIISFTVSDGSVANPNSNTITKTVAITSLNDPPVASSLVINAANTRIGTVNTASFTFTDPDGDAPGTHLYKWYRSEFPDGTDAIFITGATGNTYKPVKADGGNYIAFGVTPVDQHALAGKSDTSAFRYINAAPVASSVHIYAVTSAPGSTIRGRFSYSDKENNTRGNAIYRWYRSDLPNPTASSPGSQISIDSTYRLRSADAGKYIWFRVSPVATSGSTPGDSVWSNIIGPIGEFSANIAGSDTFCYGTTMHITLTITGGTPNFTAILNRAGSTTNKDTTISGILASPYTINVKIPGDYTLKTLTDANDDEATVSTGVVDLVVNARPRALLTPATIEICNDGVSKAVLPVNFTSGTSPWNITIRRRENALYDTLLVGVSADPFNFQARVVSNLPTRHRIISITDANGCPGDTTSGSAWVSYKPSPAAAISGIDSICPGEPATLTVALSPESTPPWSFSYLRNGANPVTISGITGYSYSLQVTTPGIYTLSAVTDLRCTGRVSGTGEVRLSPVPTASLSGTATICEHTTANLNIALTGKADWRYSYRLNGGTPVEVINVKSSPNTLPVDKAGTYTLYEVYDKNCKGTVSGSAVITVTQAPDVTVTGLDPAYNKDIIRVPVYGNPLNGYFSDHDALILYNGSLHFWPFVAGVGTHQIIYNYQDPGTHCFGRDTAIVRVLEADASIFFENDRINYCRNDQPFEITGVNLVGSIGSFTISGGIGLVDHGDNTATINPAQLAANRYTIIYTYYDDGAPLSQPADFNVGNAPVADFTWVTECFQEGQPIEFRNTSTSQFGFLTDSSFVWKIYNNTGYDADSSQHITRTFAEPGNHEVELQLQNSFGCISSVRKTFPLRPVYPLADITFFESFETSPIEWRSDSAATSLMNSWELGTPAKHGPAGNLRGFSGAYSGVNCWHIYKPLSSSPREDSWISSPCFDFTGTEKPMLKLEIWRLFNALRDGAVVQASADSGKSWTLVGELFDGVNWYNEYLIYGKPGGQYVGWANVRDGGWIETRHALDFLKGQSRVQFRIAYGSDGTTLNTDGIAFDDFWIGERNRMSLVEHFTNSSDLLSSKADSSLDAMAYEYGMHMIDLQYHTATPTGDPFYEDNQVIPTTRQFYYGLSNVPYALLNGGTIPDHRFDYVNKQLDKNAIIIQSLLKSKFSINLHSELRGNTVEVECEISSLDPIPLTELSVRIAVVEKEVVSVTGNNGDTLFRSVVKAMLPGAAGTTIYKSWAVGEYKRINQTWATENVYDFDQLRVVAFIQNESTNEVYHVVIDTIGLPTGFDYPKPERNGERNYQVYPNPADRMTMVKFAEETRQPVTLELFNNVGRLVYVYQLPSGSVSSEVPVENLPEGLYLLRLRTDQKLLGVNKVIISR